MYLCERCGRGDSVGESSVSKERRGSSQWKRENTRNEGRPEAGRKNLLNKYDLHSYLTLSRTCEVPASPEVHFLHAFGEHDLVDGACEREGEERKKDETRNEEACAAELQKTI